MLTRLKVTHCPTTHAPVRPPPPPLLQKRFCDMDQSADARRRAAGHEAEAEARAGKAAYDRARREAAIPAGGVTSASGGGGGGVSTKDTLLNGGK